MALIHVDLTNGDDANDGSSWTDTGAAGPMRTIQAGMTAAGAGGIVFVRGNGTEGSAGNKDTAAAARVLGVNTTSTNPILVIGVKSGTTSEGTDIVASDLCVRGTDVLPEF